MELSPETIKALLDAFDRSDWREMIVTVGDDRLHVSRDASANGGPPPPPAAATRAAAAEPVAPEPTAPEPPTTGPPALPADSTVVESPSVGLFWRAPAPGAEPFVEVGERVASGDTVAIVEVMKLMNHVVAPVDGTVTAILVENGAAVEFGQALVVIEPEA
jgi:acetyl-CoA carboxylase biotin carboxyl carrier protein